MKYWIQDSEKGGLVFYLERATKMFLSKCGHSLSSCADDADVILIPVHDIDDLSALKKTRSLYKSKRILSFGLISPFVGPLSIWSDAVCVGFWFDLFNLQCWDDVLNAPYVYTKEKRAVVPSADIPWDIFPMIQYDRDKWYYLGSLGGCVQGVPYYNLTVFPVKQNAGLRVRKAWNQLQKVNKDASLYVLSDNIRYNGVPSRIQSYKIQEYIRPIRIDSGVIVRLPIWFASDKNRSKYGESIKDDEVAEAFRLAKKRGNPIKAYYLAGLDTPGEWLKHFVNVFDVDREKFPIVQIRLSNLVIYPFTKFYEEKDAVDPSLLIQDVFRYKILTSVYNKRMKISFSINSPLKALCDTYKSWADTEEEYDKIIEFERSSRINDFKPVYSWAKSAGLYSKEWPSFVANKGVEP